MSAELGDVVLAASVRDTSRARLLEAMRSGGSAPVSWRGADRVPNWYPPWLGKRTPGELATDRGPRIVRSTVHTVDLPEQSFHDAGVYEMEAAAFVESALPLASTEFVQVVKVVSDTPRTGLAVVDRDAVSEHCAAAVPWLGRLVQEFVQWRAIRSSDGLVGDLSHRWAERLRLSASQHRQFERLVERAVVLIPTQESVGEDSGQEAEPDLDRLEALLSRFDGDPQGRRVRADGKRVLSQFSRWVDDLAVGRDGDLRSAELAAGGDEPPTRASSEGES